MVEVAGPRKRIAVFQSPQRMTIQIKPNPQEITKFQLMLLVVFASLFTYVVLHEHFVGILPFGMKYRGGGPPLPTFIFINWGIMLGLIFTLLIKLSWKYGGLESLVLEGQKIRRTRTRFGFGKPSEFELELAKNAEITPTRSRKQRGLFPNLGFDSFGLRFEPRGRMVYLITALKQDEAQEILNLIRSFKPPTSQ